MTSEHPVKALIIVDMQVDFTSGSLKVPGADKLGYQIADYIAGNIHKYRKIVATKDWHLPGSNNGGHFAPEGAEPDYVTTWPEHCVQGTEGAMFHSGLTDLAFRKFDAVFYKGHDRPDYSGFQGETTHIMGKMYLDEWLRHHGINHVTIVGVATERCVLSTALDAVELGYKAEVPKLLTAAIGGNEVRDEAIRKVYSAQGLDPDHIW